MKNFLTFFSMVLAMLVSSIDALGFTAPEELYIVGNISGKEWNVTDPVKSSRRDGNTYVFQGVTFTGTADNNQYPNEFTFITLPGSGDKPWDVVNTANRYGASVGQYQSQPINTGDTKSLKEFSPTGNDADHSSAATNFSAAAGSYDIVVNFDGETITFLQSGSYTPPNGFRH